MERAILQNNSSEGPLGPEDELFVIMPDSRGLFIYFENFP